MLYREFILQLLILKSAFFTWMRTFENVLVLSRTFCGAFFLFLGVYSTKFPLRFLIFTKYIAQYHMKGCKKFESTKMFKGRKPQNIQTLRFNVEGLKHKLKDYHFVDLIHEYDISVLAEKWKASTSKINIEGFRNHSQIRTKHKNATRNALR